MALDSRVTFIDTIVPDRGSSVGNLVKDALLVVGFSLVIALCAQVAIPLGFTPVPLTLQTLAVLLTGATLGSRRGGLALLAYLAEGAAGLPVFAGATSGLVHLFGYDGGYLWAFLVAAFVIGWLCELRLDRRFTTSVPAMLVGSAIIYIIAVPWLAVSLHLTLSQAFLAGMLPFIPGDLIKLFVAAALLPLAWKLVGRIKSTGSSRDEA